MGRHLSRARDVEDLLALVPGRLDRSERRMCYEGSSDYSIHAPNGIGSNKMTIKWKAKPVKLTTICGLLVAVALSFLFL